MVLGGALRQGGGVVRVDCTERNQVIIEGSEGIRGEIGETEREEKQDGRRERREEQRKKGKEKRRQEKEEQSTEEEEEKGNAC